MAAEEPKDPFDDVLAAWHRALPGVDLESVALSVRIQRLGLLITRNGDEAIRSHGFGLGELEVLFCLMNSAAPYEMRPSDLTKGCYVTSGAITGRVDRLAKMGLVRRIPSLVDRREMLVGLTAPGRELAAKMQHQVASASPLAIILRDLDPERRAALNDGLRYIHSRLEAMEGQLDPPATERARKIS